MTEGNYSFFERSVIGCILKEPELFEDAYQKLTADYFQEDACRVVFQAYESILKTDGDYSVQNVVKLSQNKITPNDFRSIMDDVPSVQVYKSSISGLMEEYNSRTLDSELMRIAMDRGTPEERCTELRQLLDNTEQNGAGGYKLPLPVPLTSMTGENKKPRRPELIQGTLRRGHIMVLQGAPKVGKTHMAIELAIAVASGTKWMGTHKCEQGKVMFVNFEVDDLSFVDNIERVMKAVWTKCNQQIDKDTALKNMFLWHLRGQQTNPETVTEDLIRHLRGKDYSLVILDPIYKMMDGDENSAKDMAKMFVYFDRIATATGASVLITHHHSKGDQAIKKSMFRGSGSGVIARAPDELIDVLEINNVDAACDQYGGKFKPRALQLEFTSREFGEGDIGYIKQEYMFFDYPAHVPDIHGYLSEAQSNAEENTGKGKPGRKGIQWDKLPEVFDYMVTHNTDKETDGIEFNRLLNGFSNQIKAEVSASTLERQLRVMGYSIRKNIVSKKQEFSDADADFQII